MVVLQASGIGIGADVTTSGEIAVIDLLRRSGKTFLRIFDVGANLGQFVSLALDRLESRDIELYCFEPSRRTFERLAERLSSDQRVRLNNLAISDSQGETVLFSDKPESDLASLSKRRLEHFAIPFDQSERVIARRLMPTAGCTT